jgi:serine/threonine protein kinase/formylglycine-generating enzyme required for sulfatase activity
MSDPQAVTGPLPLAKPLSLEGIVAAFDDAWQRGERPVIEAYLNGAGNQYLALLCELVHLDLEHRIRAGEAARVEDYLARFPALADERTQLVELLAAEFTHRQLNEPGISPEAFAQRFQHLAADLRQRCAQLAGAAKGTRSGRPRQRDAANAVTVSPAQAAAGEAAPADGPAAGFPEKIGRYKAQRLLGQGGFGLVFLAYDEQLDRPVAVKVPHSRLVSRPEDAQAYLAEARTVANLDHPHIVPVYDIGGSDEFPCYVVSKFIEGADLATKLKQQRLNYWDAAELVATVADALHYAHKQGLVHRDVKPGNVLIGNDGKPFVVDFGLALREENVGQGPKHAGTPAYMSPEQARGEGHRVDGRSDIFSLGVVLYELLAGRKPFRAESQIELLEQIVSFEPRPPRQYDDQIPKELERICLKALSKRASERYSTAKDMADDLRHFKGQTPPVVSGSRAPDPAVETDTKEMAQAAITPSTTPVSESRPIKIVPKGLRSFDAHDADFFLELLPGPRDRDGLPDSIRFWKTRIEEPDADNTFSVGLIYGPSGCGKSSLMKAGLLPRLSGDVLAVYVEATADETETRLLNGLRKRCPALPENLTLKETLAALRRGQGLPSGKKVLIVLDQFEQWLHAKKEEQNSELVQALRQCDGGRVQCIVMVRDDFWMAATRFMRELEVRLVEAQNSVAVDLFDLDHARKVLVAFGRAFGKLPDRSNETSKNQNEFLNQAVAGLAAEGKVVSVRLALFAEMMKGKVWKPTTLKEVGGTAGVGVTFLEETFSAATAPPEHRYHQKAARGVLKALLPESGTDIKGHMRSYNELLATSGYASRPRDFDDLVSILDAEIRLITPTDPEGQDNAEPPVAQPGAKYYQLTHDYLVHSLRDWLTRKQRETRRGRAELRLAERAASYSAKPDARHLPGWWEWPNMLLFTRRRNWTPAEHRVMKAAGRRRMSQAALITILLVVAGALGIQVRNHVYEDHQRTVAKGIVERLLDAPLESAPAIVTDLEPYRHYGDPMLHEVLAPDNQSTDPQGLRAAIGLLPVDPTQSQRIYDALLAGPANEAGVLIRVLDAQRDKWIEPLRKHVADSGASSASRLRAAMALAAYDPPVSSEANDLWDAQASFVAGQMLAEARQNPSQYEPLVVALEPAAGALVTPLAAVFRDSKGNPTERNTAATVLLRYTGTDVVALVDLINDAQPEHFQDVLFPELEKQRDKAIGPLAAELEKKATFIWNDPPLDPAWGELPDEVVARIQRADGLVAERFALCQTLPLTDFAPLTMGMDKCGYRPIRLRPYSTAEGVLVAAVWRRDGLDWRVAMGESADGLLARDKQLRTDGFAPVDVAGYVSSGTLFSALWAKESSRVDDVRLFVGLESPDTPEIKKRKDEGFAAATLHQYRDTAQSTRYAMTLRKSTADWRWNDDQRSYEAEADTDRLQRDLAICQGDLTPPAVPDPDEQLAAAEKAAAEQAVAEQPERRYSAIFEPSPFFTSRELHGLSPADHLARCLELIALGYRPAAVSIAAITPPGEAAAQRLAASVWHLPRIADADKERIALRQANAAAALVRLGEAERVWPLLAHSPDPRLRSWLVHRLAPYGAEPKLLIDRLFTERHHVAPRASATTDDVLFNAELSIRRALLLALGEFDEATLPPSDRVKLLPRLIELYQSDADAGIHAAAAWLVRRWGGGENLAEIDTKMRGEQRASDGRRWFVNSQGQSMVIVQGPAEFLMGSPADEPDRGIEEPLHAQRIGHSFAISAHEVTVEQVKKRKANFSYGRQSAQTADSPINAVIWYEAAEYCNWLSDQEGLSPCYEKNADGQYEAGMRPAADYLARSGYRLPTEAEWEFACRAGSVTSRYYGASESLLTEYAVYQKNSVTRLFPVGSLKPNDFGLFDMLGNAGEWCGEPYTGPYSHRRMARTNLDVGDASVLDTEVERVARGGSFYVIAADVRSACRFWYHPTNNSQYNGFRVARTYP